MVRNCAPVRLSQIRTVESALLVATWRGEGGKDAPEHLVMGEIMQPYFDLIRLPWRVLGKDIKSPTGLEFSTRYRVTYRQLRIAE